MVVDLQLGNRFDLAGRDVEASGLGLVGGHHLGHELVGIDACVFGQDPGEYFEGLGVPAVGVLVQACQLLCLGF